MNILQQRIVDGFTGITGRHDDPETYGGPAGDPGLIGPGSVSWEVNGDIASVGIAGTAAIVLEILHPSVIAGVQDLSSYREDPFRRARTTLGYVLGTTFGSTEAATGLIERVRRIHGRVTGTRPDGVPYRALDPELLAWVHTCIPWMIMRAFERYNRPLSPGERDRYLTEQAVIGRMGGADAVPETMAELDEYVAAMRSKLAVTEQTREFFEFLLTAPFLPKAPPGVRSRDASLPRSRRHERRPALGAAAHRLPPPRRAPAPVGRALPVAQRPRPALGVRRAPACRAGRGAGRGLMASPLIELLGEAAGAADPVPDDDRNRERILDAALA